MANKSIPETKTNPKRDTSDEKAAKTPDMPPEGPHAADHLTDPDKTPGSGVLSDGRSDGEVDAATG